jgi:hypothetical protein
LIVSKIPEGKNNLALFYHYSHKRYEILEPNLGKHRHAGEDVTAVNEPVVWLHDGERNGMHDEDGIFEFLHIVEVDQSDPRLQLDKRFDREMRDFERDFPSKGGISPRQYFYKGALTVKVIQKWDGMRYA